MLLTFADRFRYLVTCPLPIAGDVLEFCEWRAAMDTWRSVSRRAITWAEYQRDYLTMGTNLPQDPVTAFAHIFAPVTDNGAAWRDADRFVRLVVEQRSGWGRVIHDESALHLLRLGVGKVATIGFGLLVVVPMFPTETHWALSGRDSHFVAHRIAAAFAKTKSVWKREAWETFRRNLKRYVEQTAPRQQDAA